MTGAGGALARLAPRSLRSRLVLGVLALTALGLVLAAVVSTLLLRGYLVSQVDAELTRSDRTPRTAAPQQLPALPSQAPQLPSPFSVTRLGADGTVLSENRGTQLADAPAPDLAGLTVAEVRARGGRPFDVSGVGDPAYSYRAVAYPTDDGTGSIVLALSTEPVDATVARATWASVAVGLLVLGLVGLLAGRVVRVGLRPLDDVERTAQRIAAGDLDERVPPMPAGTEIGRLATSVNGMLGQIQHAFDERSAADSRLRRFVSDAGHELRTPLTSIRGYAELSRSGALSGEAAQRAAAARVEQEAVRMGVLVDELLLLARLDEQRPLDRVLVDLVPLVQATADALAVAAPDRAVVVSAPATAVVLGDAVRLRQVLDNLAANARVHTPGGTPVELLVTADEVHVVVRVVDHGPGLGPEQRVHAFERFYRGDASRTRSGGGGSGLGLSIARALAQAHGGTLDLEPTVGTGTTAVLTLPALAGPDAAAGPEAAAGPAHAVAGTQVEAPEA